jgi:8-oxo-dGTP pyrophosphatase MutT (NUDIX family)
MAEIVNFFKNNLLKNFGAQSLPESSVAIILKLVPSGNLDVLFIKRSNSEKDMHKGQIAFPGGKLERNEDTYMAVAREVKEEIGIDVASCEYLGHTGLKSAYKGGLRVNPMLLTTHLFFLKHPVALSLNPDEIFSYRWVDIKCFTHDLLLYKKPKRNSITHESFKTFFNPTGTISGYFPGLSLPPSMYSDSTDLTEYHLWGATLRKIREIVMMLPADLRKVSDKDWIYYDLDWPNKILNPIIKFTDSYFPNMLTTKYFII